MILSAQRAFSRDLGRPDLPVQRQGLAYERKVIAALRRAAPDLCTGLEHNPWFKYQDSTDPARIKVCCLDGLVAGESANFALVLEVKRTWIPEASVKLKSLYIPVVEHVFKLPTFGLVVCKNLTPDSPKPVPRVRGALESRNPEPSVLHWSGFGSIEW